MPSPNRHVARLPAFDYHTPAAYFITVCAAERARLFGTIHDGVMHPSTFGRVVEEEWQRTADLRPNVRIDAFVVMPNHVHGILWITPEATTDPRRDAACCVLPFAARPAWPGVRFRHGEDAARCVPTGIRSFGPLDAASMSSIVRAFKSAAARRINVLRGTPGAAVWQSRFHDRVVRDADELAHARRYVAGNPAAVTRSP